MTELLAPSPENIHRAARTLQSGGLVAFPTETVYGLGANALDAVAVRRIFAAKGRPSHNPIIVHVADASGVSRVAAQWPATAARLAARYWPGPLTLVLPKSPELPIEVTAGGPTVGVRVPNHPVALALLRAFGGPVAAPSANRSTELSPTRPDHVVASLGGQIDIIIDGGPCVVGIESTVLDLTTDPPTLLRPGAITAAELATVTGGVSERPGMFDVPRAPGQLPRHYAPRTPLELASDNGTSRVRLLCDQGYRVGWVTWPDAPEIAGAIRVNMASQAKAYAAGLYAALHDLDAAELQFIVVAAPPDEPAWRAVRDRLQRAACRDPILK